MKAEPYSTNCIQLDKKIRQTCELRVKGGSSYCRFRVFQVYSQTEIAVVILSEEIADIGSPILKIKCVYLIAIPKHGQ